MNDRYRIDAQTRGKALLYWHSQPLSRLARILEVQLAEKTVLSERLAEQIVTATTQAAGFSQQVRELELSLAANQAKIEAQQTMNEEVRSYFKHHTQIERDENK